MYFKKLLVLLTIIVFGFINEAHADKRNYAWTYEFQTVQKGSSELEHYMTFSSPDGSHLKGNVTTVHQLEYEIGMGDGFDAAIYNIFVQNPGGSLNYDGFKIKTRAKLADKDKFFVDPLLYLEYEGKPDFSEHEIEIKLILAKDFGGFNISFNPIFDIMKEDGEKWHTLPGYAVGISYHIHELFTLGIESKGDRTGKYLGFVLSHGRENAWIAISPSFNIGQVDKGQPEFYLRTIIGLKL